MTSDVSDFGDIPPGEPPDIVLLLDDTMPAYRIVSGLIALVNAYPDREAFGGRDVLDEWA